MTRIRFAVMFLAVAVIACVFEQIYVADFCNETKRCAENAIQCLESGDDYGYNRNKTELQNLWKRKNDVLFAISGHVLLDELSFKINALDNRDEPIYEVIAITESYYENSRIKISNIL